MVLRYAHPSQDHQSKAMDLIEKHVATEKIALAKREHHVATQSIQ
jgi:hypothetical protein